MKKTINIFWTGGMDSTLVVIKYSQLENIRLLPIYVSNANGRKTESIELDKIGKIYEKLKIDSRTKAELLPIRIVADSKESIQFPSEFPYDWEYYKRRRSSKTLSDMRKAQNKVLDLQKQRAIGIYGSNIVRIADQYMPVMSYVKTENVTVELGVNADGSIFDFPQLYTTYEEKGDGFVRTFLDEKNTDPDIYAVFKNVSFPLYGMRKIDVYNAFSDMGYQDIRSMLWHCYSPINGRPCGQCITCVPYIREGMSDMFDREALLRYIKFCERERNVINDQYAKIIDELSQNGDKN